MTSGATVKFVVLEKCITMCNNNRAQFFAMIVMLGRKGWDSITNIKLLKKQQLPVTTLSTYITTVSEKGEK